MKFSEKLQTLRKERKMSQEELADMLDVSRQAVSKWELGTSYPEMDKLLQLCKIFGCSLDDLTNDEVNVINIKENSKITVSGLVDQFLLIIRQCYFCITGMSFKEIIKMLIELLILIFILYILSLPVQYLASVIMRASYRIDFYLCQLLGKGFYVIINAIYLILALVVLGYIIKLRYLDHYEATTEEVTKSTSPIKEEEKTVVKVLETKRSSLVDVLVNIVVFFMKFVSFILCWGLYFL